MQRDRLQSWRQDILKHEKKGKKPWVSSCRAVSTARPTEEVEESKSNTASKLLGKGQELPVKRQRQPRVSLAVRARGKIACLCFLLPLPSVWSAGASHWPNPSGCQGAKILKSTSRAESWLNLEGQTKISGTVIAKIH